MIRWVGVIFLALCIFLPLFPELQKVRLGRFYGDVSFRIGKTHLFLPFGSTFALSSIAFLLAEILKLV
jgi:hypothetical protein